MRNKKNFFFLRKKKKIFFTRKKSLLLAQVEDILLAQEEDLLLVHEECDSIEAQAFTHSRLGCDLGHLPQDSMTLGATTTS